MIRYIFGVAFILQAAVLVAAPIRIDLSTNSGRRDSQAPGWVEWQIVSGPIATRTFDGVQVQLRRGSAVGWGIESFLNKAGIDTGATVTTDGVSVGGGDNGGVLQIVLTGLTPGRHSLVMYHNSVFREYYSKLSVAVDPQAAIPAADDQGPIAGNFKTVVQGVAPTQDVTHDDDAASSYVEFEAAAGRAVVVRLEPDHKGEIDNVLLNGLEIDGANPRLIALKPYPADLEQHADGDQGTLELKWTPAADAVSHDVYLAADTDPAACMARVAAADRNSPAYLGSIKEARKSAPVGKSTLLHYCWRVDEVDAQGGVRRGDVWNFRVRHTAFPGAEGYGQFAHGGRGGRVYVVTNLNDSGPGSLREAVEAEGPRTVVFDVSGLITLRSRLVFKSENRNLTIAGQTAPGKGICLRGFTFGGSGARDTIIRYMRLRLGNLNGTMDGMGLAASDHCIIDHCSISWTIDEAFSSRQGKNITFQRNLISEALNIAGHGSYSTGTGHGFAASIGGYVGSFHHNLLAHNAGRNWSLAGALNQAGHHTGKLDIRNNVVYNWSHRTTDGGAKEVNFVNNYYKPGPASKVFHVLMPERNNIGGFGPQDYYVEGNVMVGRYGPDKPLAGVRQSTDEPMSNFIKDKPFFPSLVTTHSAEEAYRSVLADVGCNMPMLDDHDKRVIEETRNGTTTYKGSISDLPGIPDSQEDVGGWEDYPEVHRPMNWDTDHDGMPDAWETGRDLNPRNPADGAADPDGDGYTNLEDYLNWLAKGNKLAS